MNTVNVSILPQIQTRKALTKIDDLFAEWGKATPDVIKEYADDVLAISCCIQRLATNESANNRYTRSLNNTETVKLITDLDRKKAENIRKYYGQKLTMLTLYGKELTKFRKDLQKFLNSEPTKIYDSLCGIVYKLPYFYDYDKSVDSIFKSMYFTNSKQNDMSEPLRRRLKFIRKLENIRRNSSNYEYWFEEYDTLNKVMFSIATNNPLLELLDRHINNDSLTVTTRYYRRKKDLNEYFVMEKWSFE